MNDKVLFITICMVILVVFVAGHTVGTNFRDADARNDGRTREQLVERGLAEYVIVDAHTGTTEWRWKE